MAPRRGRGTRVRRSRGDILLQGLTALRLLLQAPRRPGDLAAELGCSRRTVERILRVFERTEGLRLTVQRRGRFAWYRIADEPVMRALKPTNRG